MPLQEERHDRLPVRKQIAVMIVDADGVLGATQLDVLGNPRRGMADLLENLRRVEAEVAVHERRMIGDDDDASGC